MFEQRNASQFFGRVAFFSHLERRSPQEREDDARVKRMYTAMISRLPTDEPAFWSRSSKHLFQRLMSTYADELLHSHYQGLPQF